MAAVQQWSWSLCLLVLISTIIQYVLPSGTMERSMKLVLGGFVVLGMIVPITKMVQSADWDFTLETNTAATDSYLEQINEEILTQAQANVTAVIAENLQQMGVQPENIAVVMDTNEDNCIVIEKAVIRIAVSDAKKAEQIRETLQSTLGIQAEVVINGG